MILLSLALVVATAVTLAWGVFASSDPFIWVSLVAGLGAIASVAGSVVRHRRRLAPEAVPETGQRTAGSTAVGAASAGVDPAPSPTPSRPAPATPAAPAVPAAGPVSPSGTWPGAEPGAQREGQPVPQPGTEPGPPPGSRSWPWTTRPPAASDSGARSGWTGPVPVSPPPAGEAATPVADPHAPPVDEAPAPPTAEPEAAPAEAAGEPGIEQVAVRDALRVAQLDDEVLVVDGHPRYHLAGCPTLSGAAAGTDAETVPVAVSAARRGGFTPCAVCAPDATLLARSRDRARQKAQQSAEERTTERPTDEGQQV